MCKFDLRKLDFWLNLKSAGDLKTFQRINIANRPLIILCRNKEEGNGA